MPQFRNPLNNETKNQIISISTEIDTIIRREKEERNIYMDNTILTFLATFS